MQSVQQLSARRNQILQCCAEEIHRLSSLSSTGSCADQSLAGNTRRHSPCQPAQSTQASLEGLRMEPSAIRCCSHSLGKMMNISKLLLDVCNISPAQAWVNYRQDPEDRRAFRLILLSFTSSFPLLQLWAQETAIRKPYSLLQLCCTLARSAASSSPVLTLNQFSFNCLTTFWLIRTWLFYHITKII